MAKEKKAETMTGVSPEKIKHLEIILDEIKSANSNSISIKGWTVTLASASMLSATQNGIFIYGGIVLTLVLWFWDSYYAWMTRKFRGLYNDVAGLSGSPQQEIRAFALRPDLYTGEKYSFWDVFLGITTMPLYATAFLIFIMFAFII